VGKVLPRKAVAREAGRSNGNECFGPYALVLDVLLLFILH
jgi:hypothetical protein